MAIVYQTPAGSNVQFVNAEFQEACAAVFSRPDDRGTADSGTRKFKGKATGLTSFLAGLSDRQSDHDFPNCGLDGYTISEVPGNLREVILNFRGLISDPRDADQQDSSVFGTFSFQQNDGTSASIEYENPQTEYRYVVSGDKPTDKMFEGPADPDDRPIKVWNLLPYNFTTADLVIIDRCNRFEVKPAGKAWEVSESWVRELSMPVNDSFATSLSNVEIINPEE